MKLSELILCLLLVQAAVSIAKAPTPYCISKPMYQQIPLSADEKLGHDMSLSFSGYNLDIKVASPNSSNYATVTNKFIQLDRRGGYIPNIISHFVEQNGNGVGKDTFILYKDQQGSIHLNYGIIKDKNQLPQTTYTRVVETGGNNVECFDAALFMDVGVAIVDCMKKGSGVFNRNQNIFYIIDLARGNTTKINNDIFVDFTSITRRKLVKFAHPTGGFTYLLRSYFGDEVDKEHSDNTYLQLWSVPVTDPTQLQILRIVDRTYLNIQKLSIVDLDLYLDDIFLLDYETGLFRLDIMQSQRLEVTGRYRDYGFTRFAVYSDDLQDECIIALANRHAVYQINWQNIAQPKLITKYSLMESSDVKQVIMNDRYIIVQSAAMATDGSFTFRMNYTWIFTKNSRTYSNAYIIIPHNSSDVQVELDRESDKLYVADVEGLSLYQVNQARLQLHNSDQSLISKNDTLVLTAVSKDPYTNKTFTCQQKMTVFFVSRENMKIWPTGLQPTEAYSANFPGLLQLYLDPYFIGANLTFTMVDKDSLLIPQSWVNKVNITKVIFDKPPRTGDITYFHSDVIQVIGRDTVIYYYQDTSNTTHVSQCSTVWYSTELNCQLLQSYKHDSKIRAFTTVFHRQGTFSWDYYYVLVLEGSKKTVNIYDYQLQKLMFTINYAGDLQAEVTHVASSNNFLYVLRKYQKSVDVYDILKCRSTTNKTCTKQFSIDALTMKGLGVDYFAPQEIITDDMHPQVLFVKCLGSVVIVDIDNKRKLHLLDVIVSPVTQDRYFRVAVNEYRMLLVAQPDLMYQYTLQHLYSRNMVTLVKIMPTYGYVIQPNADIEFADDSNLAFINAVDRKSNLSAILIFRLGYPGTNCLFHVITLNGLYSRPGFQVEVSGSFVDYLTIIANGNFMMYRIFEYPFITINNTFFDYTFRIQAKNMIFFQYTNFINVTVVNFPQDVEPTKYFNQSVNKLLKLQNKGFSQIEDRLWFTGHVTHYNYSCEECHVPNAKVRLREHLDNFKRLHAGGNDYVQTMRGGLSVWNDLFRWRLNGSIQQIVNLPDQKQNQICQRVASTFNQVFSVTACQYLGVGIHLYVTSYASFKAFTWGPYLSSAGKVKTLQIVNDIVMLVDVGANPQYAFQQGAVYLYRVSFNHETGDQMNELQIIDSNDFVACHGWQEDEAYIGNAHLIFSTNTMAYRLYVTEITHGLFVVDFTKPIDSDEDINVLSTTYVDLNKVLADYNFHLPTDSIFLAVTFVAHKFNPHFDLQNILVTTKGYHNFEFTFVWDDKGMLVSTILHRVYYKYAFYNAVNQVRSTNGYVAVSYLLPPEHWQHNLYRKQWVAIYDSMDYQSDHQKGYSQRYMLGGFPSNSTTPLRFAFNMTYDWHTNGTRIGLIVSDNGANTMISSSIAHNLSFQVAKEAKSQTVKLIPFNDFSHYEFEIPIIVPPDDGGDSQTIIIIIIVLCSIVVVFFGIYIFAMSRRKPAVNQQRQSLLTQAQTLQRASVAEDQTNPSMREEIEVQPKYQPPKVTSLASQAQQQENQGQGGQKEQEQEQEQEQVDEQQDPVAQQEQPPAQQEEQPVAAQEQEQAQEQQQVQEAPPAAENPQQQENNNANEAIAEYQNAEVPPPDQQ